MFQDIHSLEIEDFRRLLAAAAAKRERDRLIFAVAYNHGFRVSEVVHLTPENIHDGKIDVQRGKKSRRTIHELIDSPDPLLNEKEPLLDLCARTPPNQRLFKIGRSRMDQLIKEYGAIAGIEKHKRHMHALKHTSCTQALTGNSVADLQAYYGWKSEHMVLVYTRRKPADAAPGVQRALGGRTLEKLDSTPELSAPGKVLINSRG